GSERLAGKGLSLPMDESRGLRGFIGHWVALWMHIHTASPLGDQLRSVIVSHSEGLGNIHKSDDLSEADPMFQQHLGRTSRQATPAAGLVRNRPNLSLRSRWDALLPIAQLHLLHLASPGTPPTTRMSQCSSPKHVFSHFLFADTSTH